MGEWPAVDPDGQREPPDRDRIAGPVPEDEPVLARVGGECQRERRPVGGECADRGRGDRHPEDDRDGERDRNGAGVAAATGGAGGRGGPVGVVGRDGHGSGARPITEE